MAKRERNAPLWIKFLVWFHVIAITIRCLPPVPAEAANPKDGRGLIGPENILYYNDRLKPFVEPYLWSTGLWQSWDMFAPRPSDWEGYVTATITYKDGTVKEYMYPRMYELGLGIKYFKERYRKFLERAHADAYAWIRPRFALRIALKNYTDPGNPPTKVELHRRWFTVPPTTSFPDYMKNLSGGVSKGDFSTNVLLPENPKMPPYKDDIYFTLIVKESELKELAGY